MLASDIIRRVKRQFGDETEAEIETADIISWINDAQLDIARKTQTLKGSTTVPSVVDTKVYPLPVGCIEVVRLEYNGSKLERTSVESMDQEFPGRNTTYPGGSPFLFWVWGSNFYVYPAPVDNIHNFDLYYVLSPSEVVSVSQALDIPVQMHEDVVRYCLARAKELDEEDSAAGRIMSEYNERVNYSKSEQQHPYSDSYPSVRLLPGDF